VQLAHPRGNTDIWIENDKKWMTGAESVSWLIKTLCSPSMGADTIMQWLAAWMKSID